MNARVPIAVIKLGLQKRVEQLARELAPGGRISSGIYDVKNPMRADRNAGSFKIWLRGPAAGAWKDYATGDKGDVVDLVQYLKGGERGDAIRWAQNWLGLGLVGADTLTRMKAEADGRKSRAQKIQEARDDKKRSAAFRMFCDASPKIAGTLVETYLAARGIPLGEIPNLEHGEIRFAPRLEWWKGATYSEPDGAGRRTKLEPGPSFPAMVCAIRSPLGTVQAVHCTFLREDGLKKANVGAPKLMFGLVAGCVIRLTRGPSNLTPEEARAAKVAGPLAIGEGVEDGLTIGLGVPEARVWAATSLGNLGNVAVDDPCVGSVVVARDNDWAKPQAVEAFERAIEALEAAAGDTVGVMQSHAGKDFNDLLRGEA